MGEAQVTLTIRELCRAFDRVSSLHSQALLHRLSEWRPVDVAIYSA